MMADTYFLGGIVVLVAAILTLWIVLPFAVFGIKGKLDKIIKLLERLSKGS